MIAVLVYALTLIVAVLVSRLAQRTVLSTAVLFLSGGFAVGEGVLGLVVLRAEDPIVGTIVEIALSSRCSSPTACRPGCATSRGPGGCPGGRCCSGCR